MSTERIQRPSLFQIWLMGARPRTLPAATAPVIAGTAVAFAEGHFAFGPALAALCGALLLQIGANYANDVYDYQKGADTGARVGPTRITAAGYLSPGQVKAGMWVTFTLAALCGLYLTVHAGWPVIVIGLLSIVTAIAYTAGPYPLGYNGLGELAVFLFFGPAAVCGTYYVQALRLSPAAIWTALPMGLLTVAILIVNNLRDIDTDQETGKRTLAARYGAEWTRREYIAVLGIAYLSPLFMWLTGAIGPWALVSWLSLPMAVRMCRSIYRLNGRALNQLLGQTGQLELFYSVCFTLGMVLQVLFGR